MMLKASVTDWSHVWLQLRNKLVVMGGDLGQPDLGLSTEDRQTLTREVHYIVHSAASISFVDHIHNLISHNYNVSLSVNFVKLCLMQMSHAVPQHNHSHHARVSE